MQMPSLKPGFPFWLQAGIIARLNVYVWAVFLVSLIPNDSNEALRTSAPPAFHDLPPARGAAAAPLGGNTYSLISSIILDDKYPFGTATVICFPFRSFST